MVPYHLFDTAIGTCGIAWSDKGMTRLQLPELDRTATDKRMRARVPEAEAQEPTPQMRETVADITAYLEGERIDFADVALDLKGTSPFDRSVYEAAREIRWGETVSYGELATRIGAPGDAREVGQALARNPVAIIIPCHRILAKGGKLGGFSAFGGTFTKEQLLSLEGIDLQGDAPLLPGLLPPRERPRR